MEKSQASSLLNEHNQAVARIQESVRKFHSEKRHFRIYHGSTSSTRTLNLQKDAIVDTSDMDRLFPVDLTARTVQVEPKVPMDALARHTLAHGLMPKIVMEFKGITAGGGYSGMSGESAMFKFGLFQQTVHEIQIVLGDGTLETASRTHNSDLWEHAGGSLGTFGIVTLLTIELIDAQPVVDVNVSSIPGIEAATPSMQAALEQGQEFVDGIFFSPDNIVMMVGRMTSQPTGPVLSTMQVHWFSTEVETHANRQELPITLSLKIEDYLFRYDHGAFWGGKLAFQHFHVPQNRLTKRLADPLLDSRTCYRALHKTGLANEYVVQDFGIPMDYVPKFVKFVRKEMPECQIFLVPAKSARGMEIASRFNQDPRGIVTQDQVEHLLDNRVYGVGVYGRGPRDAAAFMALNHKLEQYGARECFGTKLLYARTYFTAEEFWEIYDKKVYDGLRKKYRAESLPSVYDKLKADMDTRPKRQPVRGILGTVADKALGRKEYLLKK